MPTGIADASPTPSLSTLSINTNPIITLETTPGITCRRSPASFARLSESGACGACIRESNFAYGCSSVNVDLKASSVCFTAFAPGPVLEPQLILACFVRRFG
eukprot:3568692-Rhodomonas_salina.2